MTQKIVRLANASWLLESVMAEVLTPPDDVTDCPLNAPADDRRLDHDNPEACLSTASDASSMSKLFKDIDAAILALEFAPAEGARRIGVSLRRWRNDGASIPLDRALGLRTWGGVSPSRCDALARRNDMLRSLWRSLPDWSGFPPTVAARLMALSAARYEQNRWPRDRASSAAPSAEPAATWWRILLTVDRIPKAKRIQQILETEIQDPV